MQPIVSAVFGLIFLTLIVVAIRRVNGKKIKHVTALGLEGHGQIKSITELDLEKDGNILKDSMAGNQFPIATGTVDFQPLKGKPRRAYLVDMEKGCTVSLQKGGSVLDLKTSPQLINNVIDSDILKNAFAIKTGKAQLFVAFLVALAMGYIIGKL